MKNRTIKILLFVSLAFNIAFLGGGIFRLYMFKNHPPFHERVRNEKVREFMQQKKETGRKLRQDFHKAKDEFMKALSKPEINEAELQTLIDSLIKKQMIMEKELGRSMIDLRRELTNDEAKAVFGKFRQWMKPPEHFRKDNEHKRFPQRKDR